jgi:hypothetical protein
MKWTNPFVDYQKRGVELPPGCKDLMDVLHIERKKDPRPKRPERPAEPAATLADIGSYLLRFFSSSAGFRALWIYCNTSILTLFFGKHGLRGFVVVGALREQSVRAVLSHEGIAPLRDDLLPDNAHGLHFALTSSSDVERFVRELLVRGLGAEQASPLEFRLYEKNAA